MTSMTMRAHQSPNYEPLKEILRTLTYRPGWSFTVEEKPSCHVLLIKGLVVNTDNHSELIPLQFAVSVPPFLPPDFDWTLWLFQQILSVEEHEAKEFFKVNGVKVYDPHG